MFGIDTKAVKAAFEEWLGRALEAKTTEERLKAIEILLRKLKDSFK